MSRPTPALYQDALLVIRYLERHKDVGLRYSPSRDRMYGMTDANWDVKHSTSGYVFMFQSAAISWSSKKQKTIALSTCEAEIVAASEATREGLSLRALIDDLGFGDPSPTKLYCDSQATIATAYNPEHYTKMKHVERRHFFVRECIENHQIVVPFVSTHENIADFFTRALDPKDFFRIRNKIMNHKTSIDD